MEIGVLNFSTSVDVAGFMVAQDTDFLLRELREFVHVLLNRCVCVEKESRASYFSILLMSFPQNDKFKADMFNYQITNTL